MKKHSFLRRFSCGFVAVVCAAVGCFPVSADTQPITRISNPPQFLIDKYASDAPHAGMADAYTSLMYKFYNDIQGSVISDAIALDYPEYSYWAITYPYLTSNDNVAQCRAYLFIYKNPQIRYNNYGDPMVYDADRNWNGVYDIHCGSNDFRIEWVNSGPDITILERVENLGAGYNVHTWDYGKLAIFDSNLPAEILSALYGYKIVEKKTEDLNKDYFPDWQPDSLDDDLPPNLEWLLDDTVFRDVTDLEVPPMPTLSASDNILEYIKSFIPWLVQIVGNFLYWFSSNFETIVYNIVHLPQAISQYMYKIINIVYVAFQSFLKILLNKFLNGLLGGIRDLFTPTDGYYEMKLTEFKQHCESNFPALANINMFFTKLQNINSSRDAPALTMEGDLFGQHIVYDVDFSAIKPYIRYTDAVVIFLCYAGFLKYLMSSIPVILAGVGGGIGGSDSSSPADRYDRYGGKWLW